MSGLRKIAWGHRRRASAAGMADLMPNLRAAYEAVDTTPRPSGSPPTTSGLPASEGSSSTSTAAKKASRSM